MGHWKTNMNIAMATDEDFANSCRYFFSSPAWIQAMYSTVAAIPMGPLPADTCMAITWRIILTAILLVFSLSPILFAIRVMHLTWSIAGILGSKVCTRS